MRDNRGLMTGYWFSVNTAKGLHHVSWRNQNWGRPNLDNVVGVFDGSRDGGWMGLYVNGVLTDSLSGVGTKIVYPVFGSQKLYNGWTSQRKRNVKWYTCKCKNNSGGSVYQSLAEFQRASR